MSEKLQKVLARAGVGSRRQMEQAIRDGRVTVDGSVATLGERISGTEQVCLDGRKLKITAEKEGSRQLLMYNKPEGEICSRSDPQGRPTVFDRLPRLKHERWINIGRLDINTSGLLLFSTDGQLVHQLSHPSRQIEREYAVRVMGEVTPEMVKRLVDGVELEDGFARFWDVHDSGGEGINHWFHVVITEGRKREVRRLWESQGVRVSRLKRVRFGNVILPSRLKAGNFEPVSGKEKEALYALAGQTGVETAAKTSPENSGSDKPKRGGRSPGKAANRKGSSASPRSPKGRRSRHS